MITLKAGTCHKAAIVRLEASESACVRKEKMGSFPVLELIEIEVSQGLARIGRFFGLLYRLLELFLQQVGSMFLILHRLPEN